MRPTDVGDNSIECEEHLCWRVLELLWVDVGEDVGRTSCRGIADVCLLREVERDPCSGECEELGGDEGVAGYSAGL